MSKIRWGLLSTANINRRVIPAVRASARGELVAVASRSQAKAAAYAREWEIPQSFGSYESLLNSGAIDAVYISLPNHLHAEWTIAALNAGVHVLCEKPMAPTLAEVEAMIAASQETGLVLAEAFMYRHHPQMKITGKWVRQGRLGEITLARGIFNFAMGSRDNIRLVPEYGGGSLWDVGVYPLSFAQYVMGGPPETVFGAQWLGGTGVDETFSGLLTYSGDRMAQISASFRSPFYTQAEVIGTEGRLVHDLPFVFQKDRPSLTFYPHKGEPQPVAIPEKELYLGEVEDMHAAILDREANYLSLEETSDHIRTALALYESARLGQVVQLA